MQCSSRRWLLGVIFEVVGEFLDIFGLDCDARGHFVAAEGDEVFRAGGYCGEDIEAGDGAGGALGGCGGGVNHNGGAEEFIDDS